MGRKEWEDNTVTWSLPPARRVTQLRGPRPGTGNWVPGTRHTAGLALSACARCSGYSESGQPIPVGVAEDAHARKRYNVLPRPLAGGLQLPIRKNTPTISYTFFVREPCLQMFCSCCLPPYPLIHFLILAVRCPSLVL